MEAVLDRAAEVKRKSYRESLEQNRGAVLLSKELVTIHCNVPMELDLEGMATQEPDLEACRELFTELEFTSMLRELAPLQAACMRQLIDENRRQNRAAGFYAAARANGFAFALEAAGPAGGCGRQRGRGASRTCRCWMWWRRWSGRRGRRWACRAEAGKALTLR